MCQDFGKTLNLPQTDFPMRGGLPTREPEAISNWQKNEVYKKMVQKNEGKPLYMLHDGPPYANGDIHLGTSLNKILKDIIIKHKNMSGFKAPYIPGWDTHGLPIELKAIKEIGIDNLDNPISLREQCKDFALNCVDIQKQQFIRLGVLADFKNPYVTLQNSFESKQIEVFGEMAKKGYIYKGLKPVYWCADCHTALAEAEIEYEEDPCYSIFVKFFISKDNGVLSKHNIDVSKTSFVIWTTTTWTLPGNVAICLGKDYDYAVVKVNDEYLIIAEELVNSVLKEKDYSYEIITTIKGKDLELIEAKHPFLDRTSLVILGDHVTLESGTGCVHTAPGHGVDDYEVVVKNYSQLPLIVPVDDKGILTEEAGQFAGLNVTNDEASKAIAKHLTDNGYMFYVKRIKHQYPHCWRCKEPILFRATEQWFCSVNNFRKEALREIEKVNFIPQWGKERMASMVRDRSDWCISRQRTWGVPIPIFYCTKCGEYHIDDHSIKRVSEIFREYGSNAWYKMSSEEILAKDAKCKHCSNTGFTKETDIMDVWFDSGVSHSGVLDEREELKFPADLYLEGNDQYRGWFQSSLLTSVAVKGKAPYKNVCTHGWVVDGNGRKMSKSLGNGINPKEIVNEYGADILRLWVASSDYHTDIRISKEILKQLSESYRKIRNTARFILGNLSDFDPNKNMVEIENFDEIDKLAIIKLNSLIEKVNNAYNNLDFHIVYHSIHNFCIVEMSNFYLDILKNRLYVEKKDSLIRRSAQSAMYIILSSLSRLVAPILAFTSQEIWEFMVHDSEKNKEHILYNDMPEKIDIIGSEDIEEKWNKILMIYDDVKKVLENCRKDKVIGASLDAKLTLFIEDKANYNFFNGIKEQLKEAFIVSSFSVINEKKDEFKVLDSKLDIAISVEKANGQKCERCWSYKENIGEDNKYPTICKECADILR